ncbi:MAG: sulfatase-like hydrolase/transferase [Candidatus Aminicenantes bacterium]|nr:sulfatase-like hydrolase/transferase [Candidatus Aminicenantes bacterium]
MKEKAAKVKNNLRRELTCLILFFCLFFLKTSLFPEIKKPNILLITIDTLRADRLSCYGSLRPLTPNIDRLAQRGLLFSLAFAHTPTTLPSHANIFLGMTPPFHGVHDNLNFIVADDFLTLPEILKKEGYRTAAFVGSYLLDRRFGLSQGFDLYDDNYSRSHGQKLVNLERRAEEVIKPAIQWLKQQASPWFLWIHCYDPHDPYEPPELFRSQFINDPYNGEVAYVDFALKPLVDLMEGTPYRDSTIIIFTSDHGESLGEHGEETHGFLAYNSTLWVPLIMIVPGIKPRKINVPVSHIDLLPTVLDLAGLALLNNWQGTSLVPLFKGKRLPERKIYFESLYPYYSRGWAPIRGFYQNNLKFIDSPIPELYDLSRDFAEKNNILKSGLVAKYKNELTSLIASLSGSGQPIARARFDREKIEKLRSLGYLSSQPVTKKERENFGPEYDVKTLLPYNNQAVKAINLYQQGEKERAIKILEEIIKKCPHLDNAYANLAIIYQKEGDLNKALEILKLALTNIPSSYEFFFNYLNLLIEAKKYGEAIKFFEEKSLIYDRSVHDPEILNLVGLAYAQQGNLKKALEVYDLALAIDDKYPSLYANMGWAYLSLFLKSNDQRALQNSFEKFKRAIEIDQNFSQAYNGLGLTYRLMGNIDEAINCWQRALQFNPDLLQAYYYLGLAQMEKNNFQEAFSLLKAYQTKADPNLSKEEKDRLTSLLKICSDKLKDKR